HPKDSFIPGWSLNAHPFLGYMTPLHQFHHPMFQHLSYTFRTVPIQCHQQFWVLAPNVLVEWSRLEKSLVQFAMGLVHESRHFMPLDFDICLLPLQSNWNFALENEQYAHSRTMKCITSFLPLMDTCSFVISLHTTPQLNEPAWYRVLNKKYRIHPEWLNGI
ncbi:hypothetical protein K439DRAFT_1263806, partial [Ramaria rubella]